jgi:RNA polymerase sigma factor (sigma-70 family)
MSISPHAPPGLLERTARGDAAAIRECIDRYGGLVWSLARRLMFSDAEAEDAVQEVFVEVWKHAGRYDASIGSEASFIAMIARRRLIDRQRRASRSVDRSTVDVDQEAALASSRPLPEVAEEACQAAAAMEQLTSEQQKVLRLSIYEGLSHERIARAIGLPLGTVKTHARRGLLKLRSLLDPSKPAITRGGLEGNE